MRNIILEIACSGAIVGIILFLFVIYKIYEDYKIIKKLKSKYKGEKQ